MTPYPIGPFIGLRRLAAWPLACLVVIPRWPHTAKQPSSLPDRLQNFLQMAWIKSVPVSPLAPTQNGARLTPPRPAHVKYLQ